MKVGSSFNSEELREWTEILSLSPEVTVTVVIFQIDPKGFQLSFVLSITVLSPRLGTVGGVPVLVLRLRTVADHFE
jgi:hypothetical protein